MVLALLTETLLANAPFELIVRQPGKPDREVPLVPGVTLVGRSEECELQLADIGVSRKHIRLHIRPEQVFVEDLGTRNGTFLRGQRVTGTAPLSPGDILLIEPFSIELRARYGNATPPTPDARREAGARVDVVSGPSLAQGSYLIGPTGLSIGRSEFRDLVILDPAASRHHCDVALQNGTWRLIDNGSSNGVFLNDQRVLDARLTHGDLIRIGNTELRFVDLGVASADVGATPTPAPRLGRDPTHELSLPLPDTLAITPSVQDDTQSAGHGTDTDRIARPIVPWLPVSIGFVGVALMTLTATLAVGVVVLLLLPRAPALPIPPERPVRPPPWRVEVAADAPNLTVAALFEQGVASMRAHQPGPALTAFYRVLLLEPGNRAAERLSYTAGEHLLIGSLEGTLQTNSAARAARDAERDALISQLPRRSAAAALRDQFRDDPLVLATTGWGPSAAEAEVATRIDEATALANDGRWTEASSAFAEALRQTRNPALLERARFGRSGVRLRLAQAAASAWRAGVEAERRGDLERAKADYSLALERDPTHVSARLRLAALAGASP